MDENEKISLREEADREQLAYLQAWRKQQEKKQEELNAVSHRVAEGKESHLRAVLDRLRIRWQYRVCNSPDNIA